MTETKKRYRWIYGELRSEKRGAKPTQEAGGDELFELRLWGHPMSDIELVRGRDQLHAVTVYADRVMQSSRTKDTPIHILSGDGRTRWTFEQGKLVNTVNRYRSPFNTGGQS